MSGFSKYRDRFLEDWYHTNGKAYFLIICLLYFASFFLKRLFVIDSIAAFEILEQRGEMWLMDLFFGLQYLSVPLFLAWKFSLTAFVLWVGCFMFGYRITYAQIWKLVLVMELVFIVPELLKTLWLVVLANDPDYFEVMAFYPLSLMHFFDYSQIPSSWHYPLKALNLFELVYWALLALGIFWVSGKKLKISVTIVATSYVLFFLLWLGYYVVVYR
ncbi:sulfate ABC transporter permease [Marinoscillum furvescens]|uniref:Sulfate ABC transporter permease n=1 Tax=Marinoscillum furvescens DSM 4134 TaxID=1122208 RepID=A0A3D9L3D4_MARFU|nr:sulfate ABC transporter permease [Marinoscillum furvescens]RED99563.1 hypothetical protein C7460_108185 [Marinoscillum furvescens DSM 4134]